MSHTSVELLLTMQQAGIALAQNTAESSDCLEFRAGRAFRQVVTILVNIAWLLRDRQVLFVPEVLGNFSGNDQKPRKGGF